MLSLHCLGALFAADSRVSRVTSRARCVRDLFCVCVCLGVCVVILRAMVSARYVTERCLPRSPACNVHPFAMSPRVHHCMSSLFRVCALLYNRLWCVGSRTLPFRSLLPPRARFASSTPAPRLRRVARAARRRPFFALSRNVVDSSCTRKAIIHFFGASPGVRFFLFRKSSADWTVCATRVAALCVVCARYRRLSRCVAPFPSVARGCLAHRPRTCLSRGASRRCAARSR